MKIEEVPPLWVVHIRHMELPGGVFNFGMAEIHGFYATFMEAEDAAKKAYEKLHGLPDLHVTISRCVKTYCNTGIALSPIKKEEGE